MQFQSYLVFTLIHLIELVGKYMINAKDNWFYSFDNDNLQFNSITASGYPSFDRAGDMIFNPSNNTVQFWRSGTDKVYEVSINGGSITQIANGSSSSTLYGSDPIYSALTTKPAIIHGYGFGAVRKQCI